VGGWKGEASMANVLINQKDRIRPNWAKKKGQRKYKKKDTKKKRKKVVARKGEGLMGRGKRGFRNKTNRQTMAGYHSTNKVRWNTKD